MTDITQASPAASTIPDAAKYADPAFVPNVKPATPLVVDEGALARKFDGKMHGRMTAAKSESDWMDIKTIAVNAHGNDNLRANVRDRILKDCPYDYMKAAFRTEIGFEKVPVVVKRPEPEVDAWRAAAIQVHGMICRAQDAPDEQKKLCWNAVMFVVVKHQKVGALRKDALERFLKECPRTEAYNTLWFTYNRETGQLPGILKGTPSPLGNSTAEKKASEARKKAQRKAEADAQPKQAAKPAEAPQQKAKKGKKNSDGKKGGDKKKK